MSIEHRCTNFLESLYAQDVGTHAPLIFITHSMGGLLVKLALCEASRSHNNRYLKVLQNTKGVVFFATPHRGSNLAALGSLLKKVFRASYSIATLQPLTEKLMNLNADFGQLGIPSYSFGESKGLPIVGLIVEEFSAKSGLPNEVYIPVDEDHFSICKPHSKDSQTYHFTYNFLKEQFKSILKDAPEVKDMPTSVYHAERTTNNQNNNNNAQKEDEGVSTGTVVALGGVYVGLTAIAIGIVAAIKMLQRP